MAESQNQSGKTEPFGGYSNRAIRQENEKLTHVGPGTPGGDYLRRFWHPIELSSEISDIPKLIRIFGEDLILFRDLEDWLTSLPETRGTLHALQYGGLPDE